MAENRGDRPEDAGAEAEARVTKYDMVINIAKVTGLNQSDIKCIVQMVLDGIIDVLVAERRVEFRNLGVFEVRHRKARKARKARNPRSSRSRPSGAKSVTRANT